MLLQIFYKVLHFIKFLKMVAQFALALYFQKNLRLHFFGLYFLAQFALAVYRLNISVTQFALMI